MRRIIGLQSGELLVGALVWTSYLHAVRALAVFDTTSRDAA